MVEQESQQVYINVEVFRNKKYVESLKQFLRDTMGDVSIAEDADDVVVTVPIKSRKPVKQYIKKFLYVSGYKTKLRVVAQAKQNRRGYMIRERVI
jgi:hypothetical protein